MSNKIISYERGHFKENGIRFDSGFTVNNEGVTLVEVMISMVILLIVFMGLIQASLLTINHNLRNEARDEAVRVGAASMALLRSFNYSCGELDTVGTANLVNGGITGNYANCGRTAALTGGQLTALNTPTRNFRNLSITYTVRKGVDLVGINTKRLAVEVRWNYPGEQVDPAHPEGSQVHTIYYNMRNPVQ